MTASPGDILIITWALGTDSSIGRYEGMISGVDTTELGRVGGSALELTGQGFDPIGNPNAPFSEQFYEAWSDGAPTLPSFVFAGNDGELWRILYTVTNPVTDSAADMTYTFNDEFRQCRDDFGSPCPGTPGSASLRVDAVPEPSTFLLLGSGVAGLAGFGRKPRT